ncbi:MAG: phosphonate ABC transporter ATP-binding protein [Phycisphaerales bacterium JB047]
MFRRASNSVTAILQAVHLGMTYGGRFEALRDVDMTIQRGERVAIIGRSGAGKSTLLRIFNRLLQPTDGQLKLDGKDITNAQGRELRKVRQRVGMVFQQFNLVSRLSVLDNVLVGTLAQREGLSVLPTIWRQFNRKEREWAMECLREVEIEHLAPKRATELSGGQQQRVAIARLLAQRADIILADEPIASLDPRSAEQVMNMLRQVNETHGVAVITNLHQVDVATQFAQRIIGLRDGRMVMDTTADNLNDELLEMLYGDQLKHAQHPSEADARGHGVIEPQGNFNDASLPQALV